MKRLIIAGVAVCALNAHEVFASCTGPFLTSTNLHTVLDGNTAWVGAHTPNATTCEYHSGGTVIDWKKGASDPVDPTKAVGTYTIAGSPTGATVSYTYNNGGGTYKYLVTSTGSNTYNFCISSAPFTTYSVTVLSGQTAC
jgi:hypothetical protein